MKKQEGEGDMSKEGIKERKPRGLGLLWSTRGISNAINVVLIMNIAYYCTDIVGLNVGIIGALFAASMVQIAHTKGIKKVIADVLDRDKKVVAHIERKTNGNYLEEIEINEAKVDGTIFVPISIVGENGIVESNNDKLLTVSVEGGELLGFGSANPRTEESFLTGSYTTFFGRALACVRSDKKGQIIIKVQGEGISEQTCQIEIE